MRTFGRDLDRELALEIIRNAAARSRHSKHHEAHLRGEMTQAEAARELGMKERAFKAAHHRFRERLSRDIWEEVSKLVGPDQAESSFGNTGYLMSLCLQMESDHQGIQGIQKQYLHLMLKLFTSAYVWSLLA